MEQILVPWTFIALVSSNKRYIRRLSRLFKACVKISPRSGLISQSKNVRTLIGHGNIDFFKLNYRMEDALNISEIFIDTRIAINNIRIFVDEVVVTPVVTVLVTITFCIG